MTMYAETITVADLERDPYPIYARLRRESPVAWVPAVNLWMVTRASDVETVASRPDLFTAKVADSPVDRSFGGSTVMTLDGDEHLELRRSLDAKYRPRVVATYVDDLVTPLAERFLERLLARPQCTAELVVDYFEPISVLSLGSVLGLGHLSADTLQEWFHGLAMGAINFEHDPDKQRLNDETAARIDAELRPLMSSLRTDPDDSTIASMLTHGCPVGAARSIEQVMPSLKLIILGGMQEPGHGAASCLVGLLQHPEQLAWVRQDPARWEDAVHEALRWMAPIGTQTGAMVAGVVASACRDETVVDRPDEFDVRRERRPHAAFGYGPHFCAGHAFARGVEQIALRVLCDALPDLSLDDGHEVVFRGWEFRAPTAVHVRW
jgi:cytochrome P450